jgi:hypothetical protein
MSPVAVLVQHKYQYSGSISSRKFHLPGEGGVSYRPAGDNPQPLIYHWKTVLEAITAVAVRALGPPVGASPYPVGMFNERQLLLR